MDQELEHFLCLTDAPSRNVDSWGSTTWTYGYFVGFFWGGVFFLFLSSSSSSVVVGDTEQIPYHFDDSRVTGPRQAYAAYLTAYIYIRYVWHIRQDFASCECIYEVRSTEYRSYHAYLQGSTQGKCVTRSTIND